MASLPNKLYEYVAAGLPVLAGDVPVLADEVRRHRLGLVADGRNPQAVAGAIRSMLGARGQARLLQIARPARLRGELGAGGDEARQRLPHYDHGTMTTLGACNVCDPSLQERSLRGDIGGLISETDEPARLKCESEGCGSRPRSRTFKLLYQEHLRHRLNGGKDELTAVEVDGIASTRRFLKQDFGTVVDAGSEKRAVPTDPVKLDEFNNRSVNLLVMPQTLERTARWEEVLSASARKLDFNGLVAFSVDARSLRANEREAADPRASGQSSEPKGGRRILVGLWWALDTMEDAGLQAEFVRYVDPFSGQETPWFVGRKLEQPRPRPA